MADVGKWQRRILATLETFPPLTMRQLRIRCGAETRNAYATCRHATRTLLRQGKIQQLKNGCYTEAPS